MVPFSPKGQDFAGHPASVATTQPCCWGVKAAKDKMEHCCVPVKPLLETIGGQIQPEGCSLLTSGRYRNSSRTLEFKTVLRASDHGDFYLCSSQGRWPMNPYPTLRDSVTIGWGLGVCISASNADDSNVGRLQGSVLQESLVS